MQNISNEAQITLTVYDLLKDQGWGETSIDAQHHIKTNNGPYYPDYVLKDSQGVPIAVIECKRAKIDPYIAKQQAEPYAKELNAPFIFLTNGDKIYFYDYVQSDARLVNSFFTQKDLERRKALKSHKEPLSKLEYKTEFISISNTTLSLFTNIEIKLDFKATFDKSNGCIES